MAGGKLLRAIVLTLLLTAVLLAANAVAGMVSQGVLTWQQAMEAIRQGQLWRFGSLEIWLGQLWLIQHENWQENVLQHSAVILGGAVCLCRECAPAGSAAQRAGWIPRWDQYRIGNGVGLCRRKIFSAGFSPSGRLCRHLDGRTWETDRCGGNAGAAVSVGDCITNNLISSGGIDYDCTGM